MASHNRYEKRPLDGCAAQGFSAAYDADRARAEKELAGTMAGPSDACTEDEKSANTESQAKADSKMRQSPVAMGGRTAHEAAR